MSNAPPKSSNARIEMLILSPSHDWSNAILDHLCLLNDRRFKTCVFWMTLSLYDLWFLISDVSLNEWRYEEIYLSSMVKPPVFTKQTSLLRLLYIYSPNTKRNPFQPFPIPRWQPKWISYVRYNMNDSDIKIHHRLVFITIHDKW